MDEATADIDPVTASLINAAIDRLTAARTVIVVAHRPSPIARRPLTGATDSSAWSTVTWRHLI